MLEKKHSEKLGTMKYVIAVIIFIFAYGILFAIGSAYQPLSSAVSEIPVINLFFPFPPVWDNAGMPITQTSMMNLLMPIVGFWLVFLLLGPIEEYFEFSGKEKFYFRIAFPFVFIIFCLLGFFVAIYYMGAESAFLGESKELATTIMSNFSASFWPELRNSAFYLFLLSGLFGYGARLIVEKLNF